VLLFLFLISASLFMVQGLTSLVGDILSELLLSTAREVPLGIAVAILDAFRGEEIFLSPTFGTIGNVLSVVCESWVTLIEAKLNRVVCPGDNAVNILRNEILIRLRALSISLRGDSLTSTSESSQEVFVGLTKTLISLKGETPREAKVGLKQRLTVAARRLGFWQSVLSVSEIGLQTDPRPANSALTAVGMGCLVGDARRVIALLKRSDLFATYRRTNGMHLLESSDVSISPDTGFADLLETSCQLGLDEHLSDDDEEVRAINHFRGHWKRTLSDSNNSLGGYIAILSCLLESLFRSEVASGGWRTGHSGDGVTVETRLRNRMSVGSDLMRKMPQLGWHSRSVGPSSRTNRLMNQSSRLSSAGRWYRYSSVDCEELGHAASFVDHCTRQTALVMNNDDDKTLSYEEKMSRQQAWSGISAVVKDIASLIAAALLERYLFLIVCSLRALLLEVNKAVDSNTCKQPAVVAVAEAISCLLVIPAPWGAACGARGDIAHDVINALHNLRRLPSIIDSSLSKELVLIASDWTARMVRRIPVFVINLDRRRDRWRKFVLANERMGVNAIRVCAVDGASYVSVDSDEGMSRSLNNLVPETDVLSFWDSTLNNQFDSGCMVNTHTPLTPAERACATSHLKVWRAIAGIRARLGLGAPQTRQDQAVDHVGCTSAGMKGMDLAHCVYAMYHRETTFRKKRSMVDLSSSEEQDYYLVFEDDAAVPLAKQAGFRKDVALLMRKLPIHVDILYLGGAVPKRANGFKCKFACDKLFNQVNYIWMLHAYIIRGRAVDILLSNLPIHSPVDNFLASLIYQNQLVVSALQFLCCFFREINSLLLGFCRDE
jgi:GR25 family glycosyltransferase involved in LPS biosynthesis